MPSHTSHPKPSTSTINVQSSATPSNEPPVQPPAKVVPSAAWTGHQPPRLTTSHSSNSFEGDTNESRRRSRRQRTTSLRAAVDDVSLATKAVVGLCVVIATAVAGLQGFGAGQQMTDGGRQLAWDPQLVVLLVGVAADSGVLVVADE
ncbi:hypothetical protein Dimus_020570 [Dionaea muscipula]